MLCDNRHLIDECRCYVRSSSPNGLYATIAFIYDIDLDMHLNIDHDQSLIDKSIKIVVLLASLLYPL